MADLTVEEVATELALHYETVRRFVQRGRIPGYKAGVRQWRVTRKALDAYKNQRANAAIGLAKNNSSKEDRYGQNN